MSFINKCSFNLCKVQYLNKKNKIQKTAIIYFVTESIHFLIQSNLLERDNHDHFFVFYIIYSELLRNNFINKFNCRTTDFN